eukprot:575886-Ditylum_brightwellii.AAC.1
MLTKMEEMMQHLFTTMTNTTSIPSMTNTMINTQAQTLTPMQFSTNMEHTKMPTSLKPQNMQQPPGPITPIMQTQQYGRLT